MYFPRETENPLGGEVEAGREGKKMTARVKIAKNREDKGRQTCHTSFINASLCESSQSGDNLRTNIKENPGRQGYTTI